MNKRKPIESLRAKYVDDLSLGKSINLRENLVMNPDPCITRPVTFRERFNQILVTNPLQRELQELSQYNKEHQMKENTSKTKVMLFNTARDYDFMPKLTFQNEGQTEDYLEVVDTFKLLGVMIRSDMKWCDNIDFICKKGYTKLWILRRLKILDFSKEELWDVFTKQIRPVLEYAVPVWHPGITQKESNQIERVQKCALHVILGDDYHSYGNALEVLDCETLEARREQICEKFVRKSVKHSKYKNWFSFHYRNYGIETRSSQLKSLKPVTCRTERYKRSPLPYLTALWNQKVGK